jgi:hypothetical protein
MNMESIVAKLKERDVIFTSIPNHLYQCVEKATNSPTSHVGVVFKCKGKWFVAESRIPFSCYTPLVDFITRSRDNRYAIKRVKEGLTKVETEALKLQCERQMGRLYGLGFKFHSKRQFCSKFVYDAYKTALDIELGTLETFAELLRRNPKTSTKFWRLWYVGLIPWKRITITPESQYSDQKLVTIAEHLLGTSAKINQLNVIPADYSSTAKKGMS